MQIGQIESIVDFNRAKFYFYTSSPQLQPPCWYNAWRQSPTKVFLSNISYLQDLCNLQPVRLVHVICVWYETQDGACLKHSIRHIRYTCHMRVSQCICIHCHWYETQEHEAFVTLMCRWMRQQLPVVNPQLNPLLPLHGHCFGANTCTHTHTCMHACTHVLCLTDISPLIVMV